MIYGYARVLTTGPSIAAQVRELTQAGCTKVFRETINGNRKSQTGYHPQLDQVLAELRPGDMLLVTKLDRVAHSAVELFTMMDEATRKGANFRSLHEAWADTTTQRGRERLADLRWLVTLERELIRARNREGRARAVARGQHIGPPFKLTEAQKKDALARMAAGEFQSDIARSYNVSESAISRLKLATAGSVSRVPPPGKNSAKA